MISPKVKGWREIKLGEKTQPETDIINLKLLSNKSPRVPNTSQHIHGARMCNSPLRHVWTIKCAERARGMLNTVTLLSSPSPQRHALVKTPPVLLPEGNGLKRDYLDHNIQLYYAKHVTWHSVFIPSPVCKCTSIKRPVCDKCVQYRHVFESIIAPSLSMGGGISLHCALGIAWSRQQYENKLERFYIFQIPVERVNCIYNLL